MSEESFRFSGVNRLYGNHSEEVLAKSHVCVMGIGGVGSWSVEALARSGVGKITLVDLDEICITNVNRQIHALDGEIGKLKIESIAKRCNLINPNIEINCIADFFTKSSAEEILSIDFDYVIDAIDSIDNKILLAVECTKRKIPLVTVGGAGGKQDPTQVHKGDLTQAFNDRLLHRLRKRLRQEHGFPREGVSFGIQSVFSPELPYLQNEDGSVCQTKKDEQKSYKLDCYTGYGSISPVTGTFGFSAASIVISSLLKK
jgi:tRNA A37 threonylcarbamoyladenosine dehydratase